MAFLSSAGRGSSRLARPPPSSTRPGRPHEEWAPGRAVTCHSAPFASEADATAVTAAAVVTFAAGTGVARVAKRLDDAQLLLSHSHAVASTHVRG